MTASLPQLPLPLEPTLDLNQKLRTVAKLMRLTPRQMQQCLDANTSDPAVQESYLDNKLAEIEGLPRLVRRSKVTR